MSGCTDQPCKQLLGRMRAAICTASTAVLRIRCDKEGLWSDRVQPTSHAAGQQCVMSRAYIATRPKLCISVSDRIFATALTGARCCSHAHRPDGVSQPLIECSVNMTMMRFAVP